MASWISERLLNLLNGMSRVTSSEKTKAATLVSFCPMGNAANSLARKSSCNLQLSGDPPGGLLSLMLPELSMIRHRSSLARQVGVGTVNKIRTHQCQNYLGNQVNSKSPVSFIRTGQQVMQLPCEHLHLMPQYPFDDTKINDKYTVAMAV